MRKLGRIALILLLLVGIVFGYNQFKMLNVEKSVMEHLTNEKNISEDEIISSESFIANLEGDKNWMVSIKIKDDDKTYYYYKSKGEIILESYTENGVEHVQ